MAKRPSDAEEFAIQRVLQHVDSNRADLIQRVVDVMPIADELLQTNMIHQEMYNDILTAGTSQKQMRLLYRVLDSGGDTVKSAFYTALEKNCPHLVPSSASGDKTTAATQEASGSVAENMKQVQHDCKASLKKKHECIFEGFAECGNKIYVDRIYTELYITEGRSEGVNTEHEVRQIETKIRRQCAEETKINCNDIFSCSCGQNKTIRTVLTKGIAGIGKTVSVHKFILDWAEGKANHDVQYMFVLPFRELNLIKDEQYSLLGLLQYFHPESKDLLSCENIINQKTVLVFDGLDENRVPLNFQAKKFMDVTEVTSADVLITNVIKGHLLPSALLWITTRPAAASQIPAEFIDKVTEIRGFNDPQKEEYFRKRFSDQNLARRIIFHMKTSRSLYIMCHIPVFCWISATVLEQMLGNDGREEMPTTLTQMYSHFLLIQNKTVKIKYSQNLVEKKIIMKLGKLAFNQLQMGNLIFYEEDLNTCGIDVNDASVYSGLCTQIFKKEDLLAQRKVYSFVHLSIQEFLAALFVFHTFRNSNINLLEQSLTTKFQMLFKRQKLFNLHRSAVNRALESKNGHLDLFLRFLLGMSLDSNQSLLQGLLTKNESSSQCIERTVKYIKKKLKNNVSPERSINLFHCLNELNDHNLVDEIQSYLNAEKMSTNWLSPAQWSALVFVLLTSSEELDVFDLRKYIRSDEGLLKLMPVVQFSTTALLNQCNLTERCCEALASTLSSASSHLTVLDLSDNDLQDSGLKMLCTGLGNQLCKLDTLRLNQCNLAERCCEALASTLSSASSHLTVLDLSDNDLQDSGVKMLCTGLGNQHCKLDTLRLNQCNLTERCCEALASTLSSALSNLTVLDLSDNVLQDSGVKMLCTGLGNQLCKLDTLRLNQCNLTERCCEALASTLSSASSHLTVLDLSDNDLQDSGVKMLCTGLGNQLCKLDTLRLNQCNLTERCCEALASTLSSASSHLTVLDLSDNDLQDSGLKMLCTGLENQHCKLDTLRLSGCCVTERGCAFLASALASNPSHLRQLDLSYNHPGDTGVKLLSALLEDPHCKLDTLLVDYGGQHRISPRLRKYSYQLTLDPNTANRNLYLSEDRRKVTRGVEAQPYPDHPDRFDCHRQVLCVESLTGRCYWEVQWGGEYGVRVGVTYKEINRKGESDDCELGSNEKSWTLFCSSKRYYIRHNCKQTDIAEPPSSRIVGVYLDWVAGTLSFYRVSSAGLSLLHRFTSTFTEPLYAGFWVWINSSVSLCELE